MEADAQGIGDVAEAECQSWLDKHQDVPPNTLFADACFRSTWKELEDQNETQVIAYIGRLIVPSARMLFIQGDKDLGILTESFNQAWDNAIPLFGARPQPDYAVGFNLQAFTPQQCQKLNPFVGNIESDQSLIMGTHYMYFPFLTCEAKCGAGALDIADKQNAHSMTLALRAVATLFRSLKREKEVDRLILAFSVSHDHETVHIHGHYPVFDDIPPDLDFEVPPLPLDTGLSQDIQDHTLADDDDVPSPSTAARSPKRLRPAVQK